MEHLARLLRGRGFRVEILAASDGEDEFQHLDAHGNLVHRIDWRSSYTMRALWRFAPPLADRAGLGDLPFALRVAEKTLELTTAWNRRIQWIETTNWRSATTLLQLVPSLNARTAVRI